MNITKIDSNESFHLLETTGRVQTATIRLNQSEFTCEEFNTHPQCDQVVLLLEGELVAEVGAEKAMLHKGESLVIAAGVQHRLSNQSGGPAFAFTCYAPPAYKTDDPA